MSARRPGFTLIEVLVALGIAAGALVLLMSANHETMRRTLRAHQHSHIEDLIESKAGEIRAGIEVAPRGTFEGMPDWSWLVSRSPAQIEGLSTVVEVTLTVLAPGGSSNSARKVTFLQCVPKGAPK
jgi:prepilin-type N-terminal cleavage/methylation domain-containing protein